MLRERPVDGRRAPRSRPPAPRFVGAIEQLPPMHSALKHDGKPLYDYARAGRRGRARAAPGDDPRDRGRRRGRATAGRSTSRCSKGTYIRTLAEDIGEALGCGAHLAALRRTGSGRLALEPRRTLEALEATRRARARRRAAAGRCPARRLAAGACSHAEDAGRFLAGVRRRLPLADAPQRARLRPRAAAPSSAAATSPAAS